LRARFAAAPEDEEELGFITALGKLAKLPVGRRDAPIAIIETAQDDAVLDTDAIGINLARWELGIEFGVRTYSKIELKETDDPAFGVYLLEEQRFAPSWVDADYIGD
jgi:hypothetical protein